MTRWMPREIISRIARLVFDLFKPAPPIAPKLSVTENATPENNGHFTHLGDVLRKLDEYFTVMRRMKLADPNAYSIYRQVGGQILPARTEASGEELEPFLPGRLPSFFMVTYLLEDGEQIADSISPKVSYFEKMTFAEGVAAHRGTLYRCVYYYSDTDGTPYPVQFYIDVLDSDVRVLKQKMNTRQRIGGSVLNRVDWCYPWQLQESTEHCNRKFGTAWTIHDQAKTHFTWAVNSVVMASAAARVTVRKGSMVAALNIDILRTPQFFADRDMAYNEAGTRKRIFHIVRTHARNTVRGIQYVKSHFRGSRKFTWNGYAVEITMPGKHGINPMEVDVASTEVAEMTPEYVTGGKFAAMVARMASR